MTTGERSVHVCGMSRSGTTLVTTMLDAHPSVSMGYELMPADLPSVSDLLRAVRDARSATDGSARRVGNHLKDAGFPSAGVFVKRAARACVEPDAFVEMLESLRDAGVTALDGMAERRLISREVVRRKMRVEGTSIGGHKIGADLAGPMLRDEPDAVIVFVIRDPRDVAASQQSRGFTNDMESPRGSDLVALGITSATGGDRALRNARRRSGGHDASDHGDARAGRRSSDAGSRVIEGECAILIGSTRERGQSPAADLPQQHRTSRGGIVVNGLRPAQQALWSPTRGVRLCTRQGRASGDLNLTRVCFLITITITVAVHGIVARQ